MSDTELNELKNKCYENLDRMESEDPSFIREFRSQMAKDEILGSGSIIVPDEF